MSDDKFVLLFLPLFTSSMSIQRKHLRYFNGAADRIICDVNQGCAAEGNTFVSSLSSTNLEVDPSLEASWNVFNGLLPGCLEKSRMSSRGVFLSLSISDDKGGFFLHWKAAGQGQIFMYNHRFDLSSPPKMAI